MNFKYTWPGEILSVLTAHLYSAFLISILWCIIPIVAENKIGSVIFTAVSMLIYITYLFSTSNAIYKSDKKSYTKLTPIWYKGAILPIAIIVGNIIFAAAYSMIWKNIPAGEGLKSIWSVIVNVLCIIWFSPYQQLLPMNQTGFSMEAYVITTFIPVLFSFLGYFFGYKNIDVTKKLGFLVYEKKKKGQ